MTQAEPRGEPASYGREVTHAGGLFHAMHDALVATPVDWSSLHQEQLSPALRQLALNTWNHRVHTEFKSLQTMTQLLAAMLEAGDPLETYAGCADAVRDELRHTALCVGVVEALGATATLPDSTPQPAEFLALPAAARALGLALSLLAINEPVSVVLIRELATRCEQPAISTVLRATLRDEDGHGEFGWDYIAASLQRFDAEGRRYARMVASAALDGLRPRPTTSQDQTHSFDAATLARLGIMEPQREAALMNGCLEQQILPRLRQLGLVG